MNGVHRVVLVAILLAATTGAFADISLKTTMEFRDAGDGRVEFSGSFVNEGSQTAENAVVTVETPFPGAADAPAPIRLGPIDPRAERAWAVSYTHPEGARRGLFAAVIRIAYEDSNAFPLGTASVFRYPLGEAPPGGPAAQLDLAAPMRDIEGTALAGVAALREIAPLDGSATFTLTVTPAPDAAGRPAALRFVTPDSLAVLEPAPTLDILPDEPVTLSFSVTNLTALGGSRIPVGVILDATDADGTGRTATAQLVVPIGATPPDLLHCVQPPRTYEREVRIVALALLALFLLAQVRKTGRGRPPGGPSFGGRAAEWLTVLAVWALLAWQVRLPLVFTDTLCLGGDLPAHHYLFSHLRESLAHGRIVSWAPGWWCGFPMYQYYFPLPYLGMVALDVVLPSNIAFKLALVLGLFLTPLCTLAAARLLRLPRPAPALLVLATAPLLCDTTHTMWGVNIASTLAGMISNSWSFAFFPLAIASAVADMRDNRPRVRTALLFLAVLLSHFFTSIVLALLLGLVFVGTALSNARRTAARRALHPLALVPTGLCAALLMAWWVLPLIATRPWSVDYGDQWKISLFRNLSIGAKLAIAAAVAAVIAARRHAKGAEAVGVPPAHKESHAEFAEDAEAVGVAPALGKSHAEFAEDAETVGAALALLQAAVAFVLFRWGYSISKVFVNCRLWPFLVHAILVLGALGAASLLRRARYPRAGLAVAAVVVFAFAWDVPNSNRGYALWDFQGIEALPDAPVFFDVAERLRDTPGRFAYDMHPGNERLGSSRAFEAMPAVCGKPIVEGGILNSALGALIAYSVQGEMSDAPAGWPLRVIPKKLDAETGTRHLELLGVRHFLARSSFVQEAIEETGRWTLLHDYGKWRLYENPSVDGSLVHAYPGGLPEEENDDPQGAIVDWAQDPALADTPVVLYERSSKVRKCESAVVREGEGAKKREGEATNFRTFELSNFRTSEVPCDLSFNRLQFTTEHIGVPHLVAVSYFPNWRAVEGTERIDLAAPGLMVVTPTARTVVLEFAPTRADWIGRLLLVPGLLLLLILAKRKQP